jgi:predicted RNase H-like HicB family nuclease
MDFTIECEQEEDGRWLSEVLELPGVLAYGRTADEAIAEVEALGYRVLAEREEWLKAEIQWDMSFKEKSSQLTAAARKAKQEITQGLSEPMDYNRL